MPIVRISGESGLPLGVSSIADRRIYRHCFRCRPGLTGSESFVTYRFQEDGHGCDRKGAPGAPKRGCTPHVGPESLRVAPAPEVVAGEAGAQAGGDAGRLSKWETGEHSPPVEMLPVLAAALEAGVEEIVGGLLEVRVK